MLAGAVVTLQLLANGASAAVNFPFNQGKLPEGAKMIEAMCSVDVVARELVIKSAAWRHDVVVFVYPIDSTHLWIWDPYSKSLELDTDPQDPLAIAKAWAVSMVPGESVEQAYFEEGNVCSKLP
jgi:hypothetical protein